MNFLYQVFILMLVLFMPGFLVSLVVFGKREIDAIERLVFSFVFSVMIVALEILLAGVVGIGMNDFNVVVQIDGLLLILVLSIFILRYGNKEKN